MIKMEVLMPSSASEFNFDSACTSPIYMSAPSSPPRFGTPFFSAPTTPTRSSAFYHAFNNSNSRHGCDASLSSIPFNWEEKPGIPKITHHDNDDENIDFAFDFSGQLEKSSLPADELFHGGKIKPLKPPPCLQYENKPETSRSPKKMLKEAFSSPRSKKKDVDPFAAAFENTRNDNKRVDNHQRRYTSSEPKSDDPQRGRDQTNYKSSSHKPTRSLSPFRASDLLFDGEIDQKQPIKTSSISSTTSNSSSSSFSSSSSWYRKKWKIKDLLLFRSASEGRATTSKASSSSSSNYAVMKKINSNINQEDDLKSVSFRSSDSVCSSKRRSSSGPISAHELHYTINRAVSEEMKKKTFLPYKQGLLGCLGFNPAVNEISKGIGSMSRG